jgi:hypothetical protein
VDGWWFGDGSMVARWWFGSSLVLAWWWSGDLRRKNFKVGKRFMKFKNVKSFSEIKEAFLIKPKIFSVWLLFSVAPNAKKYEKYFSDKYLMPKQTEP